MFGDHADHYKYLTNEADLNNVVDDSIALTPRTPKRGVSILTSYTTAQLSFKKLKQQLKKVNKKNLELKAPFIRI